MAIKAAQEQGMTFIVKTITRLTLGFILLYGVYIAISGRTSPGGGFAGGVIVALSLVHVMLAFGKAVALKRLHAGALRAGMSVAALAFLAVALAGYRRGAFFANALNNEAVLPLCYAVIVGFGLFSIFVALVLLSKFDKDSE